MLLYKPMNLMEAYEKGFQHEGNGEESPEKILGNALKRQIMDISHRESGKQDDRDSISCEPFMASGEMVFDEQPEVEEEEEATQAEISVVN